MHSAVGQRGEDDGDADDEKDKAARQRAAYIIERVGLKRRLWSLFDPLCQPLRLRRRVGD